MPAVDTKITDIAAHARETLRPFQSMSPNSRPVDEWPVEDLMRYSLFMGWHKKLENYDYSVGALEYPVRY